MGARKILRSLRDVRTLSGMVDKASNPYMGYMKVSCLEMEKSRRGKEKESALQRVKNIDARLREIEAEKKTILSALSGQNGDHPAGEPGPEPSPAPGRNSGAFRVRY